MATSYPSSPTANLLISDAHLWAQAKFKKEIVSGIMKMPVLFNALVAATGTKQSFVPGITNVIGGKTSELESFEKAKYSGAEYHWKLKMLRSGNGKWMAENDTAPAGSATQQINNFKDFSVGWGTRVDDVSIPNAVIIMEDGSYQLGAGAVKESCRDAYSEHIDAMAISLWSGSPTDTTRTRTDNIIGLESWISSTNTLLGVDRTQAANAEFRGQASDAALPCSLSLIDQIVQAGVPGGASPTTLAINQFGAKPNLVIGTYDVYSKLKAEAQTKGFSVRDMTKPEANQYNIGFLDEHFMYNGRLYTFDPQWTGTKKLAVLDTSTISLQMNTARSFTMSPMVDLRRAMPNTGQRDVVTSEVETWLRLVVENPKFNFIGTNVS